MPAAPEVLSSWGKAALTYLEQALPPLQRHKHSNDHWAQIQQISGWLVKFPVMLTHSACLKLCLTSQHSQ